MAVLNYENIKAEFLRLAGITAVGDSEQLVKAAVNGFEEELDAERTETADDKAICEFAAAAEAFYRFVCLKAAGDKVICTADGRAVEKYDEDGRIKAAKALRDAAMARAERFTAEKGFEFRTSEGSV